MPVGRLIVQRTLRTERFTQSFSPLISQTTVLPRYASFRRKKWQGNGLYHRGETTETGKIPNDRSTFTAAPRSTQTRTGRPLRLILNLIELRRMEGRPSLFRAKSRSFPATTSGRKNKVVDGTTPCQPRLIELELCSAPRQLYLFRARGEPSVRRRGRYLYDYFVRVTEY